jgi:predicted transcriptional regulator
MEKRQTVTTAIDADTYRYLKMLADQSGSTESELAAEAIRVFIEDQSWQIEAIKEGIQQADSGKFATEERVNSVFSKWGVDV